MPSLQQLLETFVQKVGMKLLFNTTFHPQTDGQIKKVNGVLNQYLRNYVGVDQKDWGEHFRLDEVLL
jgi:hypothetical protein